MLTGESSAKLCICTQVFIKFLFRGMCFVFRAGNHLVPAVNGSKLFKYLKRQHLVLEQFNGYHLVESLLSSEKGVLVSVLWFSSASGLSGIRQCLEIFMVCLELPYNS